MTSTIREQVQLAVKELGDEVPDAIKKKTTESLIKMYEEGLWPKEAMGIPQQLLDTIYEYGYRMFQSGKYKDALDCFKLLRQLDPPVFRYHFAVAASYHYLKQYPDAAGNYLFCTFMEPRNPIPYFHLYDCYIKQDALEPALEALNNVIQRSGDRPQFAQLKERSLLEKQRLEKEMEARSKQTSLSAS